MKEVGVGGVIEYPNKEKQYTLCSAKLGFERITPPTTPIVRQFFKPSLSI